MRHGKWELFAPSSIAYQSGQPLPTEMCNEDLERVRIAFVDAARAALNAGFGALMLDMSHGYLLSSFLSPSTNRREDNYGGSWENRLRYPLEVFDAVRDAWPPEHPLIVALNGNDRLQNGLSTPGAVCIARKLREHGCDLIAVVAGQVAPRERYDFGPNSLAQLSDIIRNESGLPTLATGYMDTSNQPNTLLAGGRADLCLIQPTRLHVI